MRIQTFNTIFNYFIGSREPGSLMCSISMEDLIVAQTEIQEVFKERDYFKSELADMKFKFEQAKSMLKEELRR